MAMIGLVPGQDFDPSTFGFLDREVIKDRPKAGARRHGTALEEAEDDQRWLYFTSGVGNFGTDYRLRAWPTSSSGWNRPQDAV